MGWHPLMMTVCTHWSSESLSE